MSNAEIGEATFQESSSHPVTVVEERERRRGERRGAGGGAGWRCSDGATFPRCLSRPPPAWSKPAAASEAGGGSERRHGCYTKARVLRHSKPISETEVSQAVITYVFMIEYECMRKVAKPRERQLHRLPPLLLRLVDRLRHFWRMSKDMDVFMKCTT